MENLQRICRFCLEKCDTNFKAVKRSMHEILNMLHITMDLVISDEPVMCTNCSQVLQNCFVFKKTFLDIRRTMTFGDNKNNGRTVCDFCIKLLENCSFTILDIEEDIKSQKIMLEKYFPELNLSASKKPIICEACHGSLVIFLNFITITSTVEEKIRKYCEAEGVNDRNPIKLNNVVQFTSESNVFKIEGTMFVKSENKKMEIQGEMCTLCMDESETTKNIDENTRNILDIVLPQIDYTVIRGPVMCKSCEGVLMKCFEFKATCLHTHNYIVPFLNNNDDFKLDLKDIYLNRNVTCSSVSEDHNVCGLCMDLVKNCSAISLDVEEESVMLKEMIKQCLPELDFSIIWKPVICASCFGSLEDCSRFVNCVIARERMKQEMHDQGFHNDRQFTPKSKLSHSGENKKLDSIKIEEKFGGKNEIKFKEENLVEMEDQTFLFNEEIDIKTDDHEFDRFEDGIVLPQSEVTSKLHREGKCLVLCLERNQSIEQKMKCYLKKRLLKQSNPSEVIMHKCDSCSFQTKGKQHLKTHSLAHKDTSEITMYKCDSCPFQAKRKDILKSHLLVHKDPSEVTMYRCDYCTFQTKHKGNVKKHLLIHKNPPMYKSHLPTHENPPKHNYNCDSCSFKSNREGNLKTHLLLHKDPSEVAAYKCYSCSYQARHKDYLKNHLRRHRNITIYKCDFCSFQTNRNGTLKDHVLRHKDPSEIEMYKCDFCLFQTKYKKCLKTHLLKHKDLSEVTMYKCDSCSYEVNRKDNLKKHLLVHKNPSEVTVYKCDSCLYQTIRKHSLAMHLLTHKDATKPTMYKCDSCSFQAKHKGDLKKHLPEHKYPSEVTMYKCDSCSFQTKYKYSLKIHLLRHKDPSEVTMYKCHSCSFQTKHKGYLRYHLLRHTRSHQK